MTHTNILSGLEVEPERRLFLLIGGFIIILSWIVSISSISPLFSIIIGLIGIGIIGSSNISIFITKRYKDNHDFLIGVFFGLFLTYLILLISIKYKSDAGLLIYGISIFLLPTLFSIITMQRRLRESKIKEYSYGNSYFLGLLYVGLLILGMMLIVSVVGTIVAIPFIAFAEVIIGRPFAYIFILIHIIFAYFILKYLETKWIEEYLDYSLNNRRAFGFLGASCGILVALFSWSTLFYIPPSPLFHQFSLFEMLFALMISAITSAIIGFHCGYIVADNKYKEELVKQRGDLESGK